MSPLLALVDAGPIVAYYNKTDSYHIQICDYFQSCTFQLITTDPCLAEAMYLLRESHQVQSSLARDVAEGIWQRETLIYDDFERMAVLFEKYRDLPADFADLSLIVISERLNLPRIVTLDSDSNICQRFQDKPQPFNRVFYPRNS